MIQLNWMGKTALQWGQEQVKQHHYLKTPVDARCSVQGYTVDITAQDHAVTWDELGFLGIKLSDRPLPMRIGVLMFGRPEATRCYPWYGSVEDVASGRSEVTRWQVLNLARVWLHPAVQPGGKHFNRLELPGFTDRKGQFRSTLASQVIGQALDRVSFDYLMARPPCFLYEPYEIKWLLSYCDTRIHKGAIYQAAGFELYRTNRDGIETWRKRLRPLSQPEDQEVRLASQASQRSKRYRGQRIEAQDQLSFVI